MRDRRAIVTLPLTDFTASTTLTIDFEGDGTIDGVVEARGDVPAEVVFNELIIAPPAAEGGSDDEVVTSTQRSSGTLIKPMTPTPQVAGVATSTLLTDSEYLAELLRLLQELYGLLVVYQKTI